MRFKLLEHLFSCLYLGVLSREMARIEGRRFWRGENSYFGDKFCTKPDLLEIK